MRDPDISLPPMLSALGFGADADLLSEAVFRAQRGKMDPGTICYSKRPDQLDAAILLAPETPLRDAVQVIYPLMLAANDALGATVPPGVAVHLAWPDRLMVNGALAGGMTLITQTESHEAVPDWMLARLTIDVMGDPTDMVPGDVKERTSLYEEGAGEVSARGLLEAFAKYFLNWLDRWQRDGLDAVSAPFLDRAAGRGEPASFLDGAKLVMGKVHTIAPNGDLLLNSEGRLHRLQLLDLLAGPSWEL